MFDDVAHHFHPNAELLLVVGAGAWVFQQVLRGQRLALRCAPGEGVLDFGWQQFWVVGAWSNIAGIGLLLFLFGELLHPDFVQVRHLMACVGAVLGAKSQALGLLVVVVRVSSDDDAVLAALESVHGNGVPVVLVLGAHVGIVLSEGVVLVGATHMLGLLLLLVDLDGALADVLLPTHTHIVLGDSRGIVRASHDNLLLHRSR